MMGRQGGRLGWIAALAGMACTAPTNNVSDAGIVDAAPVPAPAAAGARMVRTSNAFACGLRVDSSVACWGRGARADTTLREVYDAPEPLAVPGLFNVREIAVGDTHACALLTDSSVWCWTLSVFSNGAAGFYGETVTPVTPWKVLNDVRALATGQEESCAIVDHGKAVCWNTLTRGQLASVPELNTVAQLEPHGAGYCARLDDGHVTCTGRDKLNASSLTDVKFLSTGVGAAHVCAQTGTGDVWCFGQGAHGQLGNGAAVDTLAPVLVPDIHNVVQIAASDTATCALRADGKVSCWGDADWFPGADTPWLTPRIFPGIEDARDISINHGGICIVRRSGEVACAGDNTYGQLGRGTRAGASNPAPINGLPTVTDLQLTEGRACAITSGAITCWSGPNKRPAPMHMPSEAISITREHMCSQSGSNAYCWGDNPFGALGMSAPVHVTDPVRFPVMEGTLVAIETNDVAACARVSTGQLLCSGDISTRGGYPNATPSVLRNVPATVDKLVMKSTLGCIVSNGHAQCWFGSGGDQMTFPTTQDVIDLGVGSGHACAILRDGTAVCMGANKQGQLGPNGGALSFSKPIVSIAGGDSHTCAVLSDGATWCWGDNTHGQLGGSAASTIPSQVSGIANAISVRASGNATCVITRGGAPLCFGSNAYGLLSDPETATLERVLTF